MTAATVNICEVPLPRGSLVARAFERVDYSDAFEIAIPKHAPQDVDAFTRKFITARPGWINGLMGARDAAMGLFGFKTAMPKDEDLPPRFEPGAKLGLFEVFDRADDEVLLGADDRHLNFRLSILLRRAEETFACITTIVHFNNGFGRVYFAPVKPFHKVIVRAMLRRAVE
jgi:uncharacterized protein DUF2867